MTLKVEPDLQKRTVSCEEELEIIAKQDIDTVELDAVSLDVRYVLNKETQAKLEYRINPKENRLIIRLGRTLKETERAALLISCDAEPKKGFYFITPEKDYPNKRLEA